MNNEGHQQPHPGFWRGITILLLLTLAAMMFLAGCSTVRYVDRVVTEYRDTTIVKREVRDSIVFVQLPLESNQVIVEAGDTSRLETSVAKSTAFVNEKGQICHTLENKKTKVPVTIQVPSTTVYSSAYAKEAQTLTRIEYREKPLTAWQKWQIRGFWYLCAAFLLLVAWRIIKRKFKLKIF